MPITIDVNDPTETWLALLELAPTDRLGFLATAKGLDPTSHAATAGLRREFAPFLDDVDGLAAAVRAWERANARNAIGAALERSAEHAAGVPEVVVPDLLTVDIALRAPTNDGEPEELLIGAQQAPSNDLAGMVAARRQR